MEGSSEPKHENTQGYLTRLTMYIFSPSKDTEETEKGNREGKRKKKYEKNHGNAQSL
jgi:hypothetical protein